MHRKIKSSYDIDMAEYIRKGKDIYGEHQAEGHLCDSEITRDHRGRFFSNGMFRK